MTRFRKSLLAALAAAFLLTGSILLTAGCADSAPANIDWAAPAGDAGSHGLSDELQHTLDEYGAAIQAKNADRLASVIDSGSPGFAAQQQTLLDNVRGVPFQRYQVSLVSMSQDSPDRVIAKVDVSYTFQASFADLPEPERMAFVMVNAPGGWKISADATQLALGKPADAQLWDLGAVQAMAGAHCLVLYHPGNEDAARQIQRLTDSAYGSLQSTVPGTDLPLVPIKIFDDKGQIDAAFPGKWQEWTGGASRQMGGSPGQGGEIIVEADLFRKTAESDPDYNRKMLAHELTHVALFPVQSGRTPPFMIEGLADYVAGEQPVTVLTPKLRSGATLTPTLGDLCQPAAFTALLDTQAATLAYEESDTAIAWIEKKYGNERTLEVLREFQRRSSEQIDQSQLVNEVFSSVLGTPWAGFEQDWRAYVLGSA